VRGEGKPQRALGFALLVLAAVAAIPAFSIAQDPGPIEAPPPAAEPPAPTQTSEPPAPPEQGDKRPDDPKPQAPAEPSPPPPPAQESPAAAAAAPAVAVPASAQAKAASATVSAGDNFFSPTSVSIFAGESVTWTNNGQAQHSATANNGSFDTGIFGPGASRSETFSSPGTYAYYCVVHGLSQSGTVRVASAGGGGGGGNGGGGGGAADDATSGSSEAAAVASPDAAGTGSSLPATGFAVLGLGGTGLVLLISGMLAERRAGRRCPEHWFSIY
jgi:plastocyanin